LKLIELDHMSQGGVAALRADASRFAGKE
jgi:hypothetical protein